MNLTVLMLGIAGAAWAVTWQLPYTPLWALLMGLLGAFVGRWVAREQERGW